MDLGLAETLIGLDPLDPVAIWDKLYVGTAMTGRRGAVVHALGAIDIALWDICGKAAGKPAWQLLGTAARESFRPYASLLPSHRGLGGSAPLVHRPSRLGPGPRLPCGEARAADLGAVRPRGLERARRADGRDDPRRARGGRAGLHDHGRRRLRLGRRRSRACRDRDVGRVRRVLRRDATLDGRPRGLPPARRALADPDRGGRMAGDALRVSRPHGSRRHPRRAA